MKKKIWIKILKYYVKSEAFTRAFNLSKNVTKIENVLSNITTASLNNDQVYLCGKDLPETYLYHSTKNMQNDKFHGNNGITKEFSAFYKGKQ